MECSNLQIDKIVIVKTIQSKIFMPNNFKKTVIFISMLGVREGWKRIPDENFLENDGNESCSCSIVVAEMEALKICRQRDQKSNKDVHLTPHKSRYPEVLCNEL